jgi:hypothetical protein
MFDRDFASWENHLKKSEKSSGGLRNSCAVSEYLSAEQSLKVYPHCQVSGGMDGISQK